MSASPAPDLRADRRTSSVSQFGPDRRGRMYNFGLLLTEQGKDAEAEQWYREAADAGMD